MPPTYVGFGWGRTQNQRRFGYRETRRFVLVVGVVGNRPSGRFVHTSRRRSCSSLRNRPNR